LLLPALPTYCSAGSATLDITQRQMGWAAAAAAAAAGDHYRPVSAGRRRRPHEQLRAPLKTGDYVTASPGYQLGSRPAAAAAHINKLCDLAILCRSATPNRRQHDCLEKVHRRVDLPLLGLVAHSAQTEYSYYRSSSVAAMSAVGLSIDNDRLLCKNG